MQENKMTTEGDQHFPCPLIITVVSTASSNLAGLEKNQKETSLVDNMHVGSRVNMKFGWKKRCDGDVIVLKKNVLIKEVRFTRD